jgi:hypothetical protein
VVSAVDSRDVTVCSCNRSVGCGINHEFLVDSLGKHCICTVVHNRAFLCTFPVRCSAMSDGDPLTELTRRVDNMTGRIDALVGRLDNLTVRIDNAIVILDGVRRELDGVNRQLASLR